MHVEDKERKFEFFTAQLVAGKELNQRDVDYWRGFYAGQKNLLDQPAAHQRIIDKANER